MTKPDLSFGVVICSYNRREILEQCLRYWSSSNRQPDQFIVVDATQDAKQYHEALIEKNSALFASSGSQYILSERPGLTLQRNIGLDQVKTDIVCFADDDTFVTPNYVDKIVEVFEQDTSQIVGGINGVAKGQFDRWSQRYSRIVRNYFRHNFGHLAQRIHVPRQNTQLFNTLPSELNRFPLINIDRLWGANMNYRLNAIGDLRFDENFKRYGLFEDVDMSVRVGQTHKLICRIDAELHHDDSLGKTTRPNDVRYFLASWLNSAYIIEKLFPVEESRSSHERLFNLLQFLSQRVSESQRKMKLRTFGDQELFKVSSAQIQALAQCQGHEALANTFVDLQESIRSYQVG